MRPRDGEDIDIMNDRTGGYWLDIVVKLSEKKPRKKKQCTLWDKMGITNCSCPGYWKL